VLKDGALRRGAIIKVTGGGLAKVELEGPDGGSLWRKPTVSCKEA